jgi:hypothetical protein
MHKISNNEKQCWHEVLLLLFKYDERTFMNKQHA